MAARSALLINCSAEQAEHVRQAAVQQRRTVSGYVLHIVIRAVEFEESIVAQHQRVSAFSAIPAAAMRPPGRRTTLLIRCAAKEAQRIRLAAKRRDTTISAFVLFSLQRSWQAAETMVQAVRLKRVGRGPR